MALESIPGLRTYHIVSWTLLILMLSQNYNFCLGTATLKVRFLTYKNPNGRDWHNEQCDLVFRTACDNLFDICIDKADGNTDIGSCKYGLKSSTEFQNQDAITFEGDMNGIANPIVVNMNKWENILLKVRVRDDDSHSSHDLVDLHYYQYVATPGVNNVENTPSDRVIVGERTSTHRTSLLVRFSVKCDSYFYGSDCTRYCKNTNDNNNGHYRCSSNGDKVCLPGWEDAANNCLVRSDDCLGHTCLNGATCVDGVRTYTCKCSSGYTGIECQVNIDECASTPCQNGGTCQDAVNGYTCECPPEYPRTLSSSCSLHLCSHDDPCQNGGTCFGEGKCLCPPNYTGARCEMHFCQSNCIVCQNGGTCTGSECVCPAGVLGEKCEVNLCDHVTCFNGGQCAAGTCQCPEGYTGLYCHEMTDHCASSPCLNGAYCIKNVKNFTCVCVDGYSGDLCDTEKPKPTTEEKDNNGVLKEKIPNVIADKEQLNTEPKTAGVIEKISTSPILFYVMMACLVFLVLIILILVLILCKDRINRKRKQMSADRGREATMSNFENPVYTVDQIRAQGRHHTYDDARYAHSISENEANAARYTETIAAGGAAGKNAEALYDYPRGGRDAGRDPLYDHPRPQGDLQQPPPYSPPEDPHYSIPRGGAVSMSELRARLEDEPHYEDVQSLKNPRPKD